MKQALYQQKGFLSTVFTALLIIAIAVTTKYFDSLFVPETSCEEFNSFLDRGLLIDSDNGFFKNNILD